MNYLATKLRGSSISTKTTDYDVDISLPKFKIEYETSIKDSLLALGLNTMFTDNSSFKNMTNNDLLVSQIMHKTYISVDEIGTEAVAVTAISMETCGIEPEKKRKEVNLNSPFAFIIIDIENNQPIFTGKISNIK